MKRFHSTAGTGRPFAGVMACAGAALVLTACASDPGEKVADAPFPKLVDVPDRPKAATTPEERAALRTQLQHRRDEINRAAASLLRGGTEPVPVALDSQLPNTTPGDTMPPPPLPEGLPPSPDRPAPRPEADASADASPTSGNPAPAAREKPVIEAPAKADMPPARAAAKKDEDGEDGEDGDESGDDGGSDN